MFTSFHFILMQVETLANSAEVAEEIECGDTVVQVDNICNMPRNAYTNVHTTLCSTNPHRRWALQVDTPK